MLPGRHPLHSIHAHHLLRIVKSFISALPLASCTHWHFFNCIVVTEQAFLSKRMDTTHESGNEDRSERDGSEMTPERRAERAQMRLAHQGKREAYGGQ